MSREKIQVRHVASGLPKIKILGRRLWVAKPSEACASSLVWERRSCQELVLQISAQDGFLLDTHACQILSSSLVLLILALPGLTLPPTRLSKIMIFFFFCICFDCLVHAVCLSKCLSVRLSACLFIAYRRFSLFGLLNIVFSVCLFISVFLFVLTTTVTSLWPKFINTAILDIVSPFSRPSIFVNVASVPRITFNILHLTHSMKALPLNIAGMLGNKFIELSLFFFFVLFL